MNEHVVIRNKFGVPPTPGNVPDFMVGSALVQPSLNRISVRGQVTQVEPKVMQVLTLMAARPGAVVPRETFLEEVWPRAGDDYLLNRSISELRKIFDDDAQSPRYIETIRKTGYRLIAPIAPARIAEAVPAPSPAAGDEGPHPAADAGHAAPQDLAVVAPAPGYDTPAPVRAVPSRTALVLAGIAGTVLVVAALAWWMAGRPQASSAMAGPFETRPLTSFVGSESEPALSPDGSRVAFVWDDDADGVPDIHVKTVGSESTLNLTRSDYAEAHPVWSNDGGAILFVRRQREGAAIMRVSALGGGATRVLRDTAAADIRGMSLSPDGASLAYAARSNAGSPYRIVLASIDSGRTRAITRPQPGTLGDIDPLFARDGETVYFVRAVNEVTKDLHATAVGGGEPRRLTFDNRKINGLTWSPDGTRLLFTSTRSGMYAVWSVGPAGGDPQQVLLGDEDVQQPSTAPGVDQVVYERWTHRAQLQRVDLARRAPIAAGDAVRSNRWNSSPAWSPDGKRIAFTSNRSGPQGIWVSDRDGRNAVQIASFGGVFVDHPAWSPDGATIAFDASPDGRTAVYTIAAEGGAPRRITQGPGDSRNPTWSRDGRWIYFESNREGAWQIYAQSAGGGEAERITSNGGTHAVESTDGAWLLYGKPDVPGLWRQARRDWRETSIAGQETRLTTALAIEDAGNWAPADGAIYFVRRQAAGPPLLSMLDATGGSVTDIMALAPASPIVGFDLAPDGSELILANMLPAESDLRLATPRRAVAASP
jgi:Tol biopolymer transport system component/DNA-binding winged helix-turn-helix (wHTH) protein